jgi:hypothetical protein
MPSIKFYSILQKQISNHTLGPGKVSHCLYRTAISCLPLSFPQRIGVSEIFICSWDLLFLLDSENESEDEALSELQKLLDCVFSFAPNSSEKMETPSNRNFLVA